MLLKTGRDLAPIISRCKVLCNLQEVGVVSLHFSRKDIDGYTRCPPHAVRNLSKNGAFTLDVKSLLNDNLGGILGGTQC